MTCPACGGQSHQTLAPGYIECTTEVLQDVIPGPGAGRPIYRTCGHRYQTAPPSGDTPSCACGMFAVARCTSCYDALCGTHVKRFDEGVRCAACYGKSIAAQAAKQQALRDQAEAARTPVTPDVLRQRLQQGGSFEHVRWEPMRAKDLAAALPSSWYRQTRIDDERHGLRGKKIRPVYADAFVYETIDLINDYESKVSHNLLRALLPTGERLKIKRFGGIGGSSTSLTREPIEHIFPASGVDSIVRAGLFRDGTFR